MTQDSDKRHKLMAYMDGQKMAEGVKPFQAGFADRPEPDPLSDAAVEAVARAFCRRMGLDPNDYGKFDLNSRHAGYRWQFFIVQAREAIAMRLAIEEVMG